MWIAGLDTETTGTKVAEDRICQIGIRAINQDTGGDVKYERLINPGVHIPAGAVAIHGIRDADVINAPGFAAIAPMLANLIGKVDVLIMHNGAGFDWPLLLYEFQRAGINLIKEPLIFDTMVEGRFATPDGKFPSLGELCWSLGVPYDVALAHGALYDVSVMLDCYNQAKKIGMW